METNAMLRVEVRRPLYRPNPIQRFRHRWRARRAKRSRSDDDGDSPWWDLASAPLEVSGAIGLAVAAVVLLIVVLVVVGPGVWLLVLLLIEASIWLLFGGASVVAWLVLGRPWQVTVVDESSTPVAEVRRRSSPSARACRGRACPAARRSNSRRRRGPPVTITSRV
jgi:hypothetical protein